MELPHIGEHCSYSGCNQLDYLPVTCGLCNKKFCNAHHRYENHSCPESYKLDVKVPICPLCQKPVPSKRGLAPDLAVNEHLENNCQSKERKIYMNKCSVQSCKVKELVSIKCDACNLSFCLRHRHTSDHDCKGPATTRDRILNGAIFKNLARGDSGKRSKSHAQKNGPQTSSVTGNASSLPSRPNAIVHVSPTVRDANVSVFQGNLSEEEALQRALLTSQEQSSLGARSQLSEDEELARAIALSLEQQQTSQSSSRGSRSSECSVS